MDIIEVPSDVTDATPSLTRRIRFGHGPGFWVIALAFLTTTAFTTVPTPLYSLYQARDGFPTWVVTVVFASYAVGVLVSLFLIGHLSDWFGRRPLILVAIGFELAAALLFLVWPEVPGLLVARFLSGVGIGALTASATAHLGELRATARPEEGPARANTVATVVNTGGLGLGALLSGVLAQFVPAPLVVPYLVFLGLLIVATIAVSLVPETVERPDRAYSYRPQRAAIPREARGAFAAAAIAAFAAFAVFGLFTSLAPTVLAGVLHETSHFVAGAVTFGVFAASALSQVVFGRLSARHQLALAIVLVVAGLALLAVGVLAAAFAVFVIGGVVAGAGVGLVFRSSIGAAARLAAPEQRGEVLAAAFLAAFAGLALPVVVIGAALLVFPLTAVIVAFALVIAVLVAWAGIRMLRTA
jgi:MFS family permease